MTRKIISNKFWVMDYGSSHEGGDNISSFSTSSQQPNSQLNTHNSRHLSAGFTLLEILIALVGVSALMLSATGYFFSILTQKDQALSSTIVSEQAETIFAVMADAVRSAQSVAVLGSGSRLEITGLTECWTFEFDSVNDQFNYAISQIDSCSPPASATQNLNSSQADITAVNFSLLDPDDSSRSLQMTMSVTAARPLSTTTRTFDRVFVNVIDE